MKPCAVHGCQMDAEAGSEVCHYHSKLEAGLLTRAPQTVNAEAKKAREAKLKRERGIAASAR